MKENYKKATGVKSPQTVRTNLLQPEKFRIIEDGKEGRLDNPIVAVEGRGSEHFYTLDTQFVGPVRMNRMTRKGKDGKVPQPNLRPETVGDIVLGDIIGTIKVGKKTHPLYDYIEVDGTPSLPEGVTKREKFVRGGVSRNDMRRSDGSVKSVRGYLGPVENTVQGGTMTEVSIGTEINGKKMEIPTMVPTLTEDEVKTLSSMKLEGNAKSIPESIIMKAKEHARMRLEQGKSPFYQDGE